jgi:hypothetical protein
MKQKYIIGVGCSWTQGEGAYPEYVWKESNGRAQVRGRPDDHRRVYEHENSWVNVLCRDHFTDYKSINLGVRGIGNRAAVKQLHFCDTVDWDNSEGYIVLMLSGVERFDFMQKDPVHPNDNGHYDGYHNGGYAHYKWKTMWPLPGSGGPMDGPLWDYYGTHLWSESFVATECLMAMLELQTFCKAYGFKMIVANAFNQLGVYPEYNMRQYMQKYTGNLADKFDWSCYLHETTPYCAMMQKLVQLDGLMEPKDWGGYYNFYEKLDWPATYLTNDVHPTIEGYKIIASEIANFVNRNNNDRS